MSTESAHPPSAATGPNPHGHAALLLVESLIYTLIDNQVLSVRGACDAVMLARDTQIGLVDADRSLEATTHLLESMLRSMESDLPVDERHG